MNANEKINIKRVFCESIEDDYERGEVGGVCSWWTDKDMGIDPARDFGSVRDALDYVTDSTNFFNLDWHWDECNREFFTDLLVDEENWIAGKDEIANWKAGKKRLYNCRVTVELCAVVRRELDDSEATNYKF